MAHPTAKEIKSVREVTVIETAASAKVSSILVSNEATEEVALQADNRMNTLSTPTAEIVAFCVRRVLFVFAIGHASAGPTW